jgi:hypothetical protein
MNATRRAALVLALSVSACSRCGKEPEAPPAAPPPPTAPMPAVPTTGPTHTGNVRGFPLRPDVKIEFPLPNGPEALRPKPPPQMPTEAEVEVIGKLTGVLPETDLRVTVAKKPCSASDSGEPYGVERLKNLGPTSPFFIEVFVPQGSTGHVCAYALKDGKVLAFGTSARNPITMQGMGEVMFTDMELPLQPVSPPVKAPAGL